MEKNKKQNIEETVICYIIKKQTVLMLYRNKKKNDLNHHKWIGVGGHIEKGETPMEAVEREVFEETSLKMKKFEKRANIMFHYGKIFEYMHVFVCTDFEGRINTDCDEGTLQWLTKKQILNEVPIWEGDKYFLEKIFNNDPFFEMVLWYEGDKLVKHELLVGKDK